MEPPGTDEHLDASAPDFVAIQKSFAVEARLHYRYIWEGFDPDEKSTALRVVRGKSLPDSLKHVLEDLEDRRYVDPSDGQPRLFAAPFAQFVRGVGNREAKPGLLSRLFGG